MHCCLVHIDLRQLPMSRVIVGLNYDSALNITTVQTTTPVSFGNWYGTRQSTVLTRKQPCLVARQTRVDASDCILGLCSDVDSLKSGF